MPELSRFFGIIIRMFDERKAPHHLPHFHAYYGDNEAVYTLDPISLLEGEMSRRQQRYSEEWAKMHLAELQVNWQLLQSGQQPLPIDPL